MDCYVVVDGSRVVGVSARLQGAELIRADEARRLAVGMDGTVTDEDYRTCYERLRIENHELENLDSTNVFTRREEIMYALAAFIPGLGLGINAGSKLLPMTGSVVGLTVAALGLVLLLLYVRRR